MKNSIPNPKSSPSRVPGIEKSGLFLRVSSSQKSVAAFHSSQLTLLLDAPLAGFLGQPITGIGVLVAASLTEASF